MLGITLDQQIRCKTTISENFEKFFKTFSLEQFSQI